MKISYYQDWGLRFFCQDKNASTTLFALLESRYHGAGYLLHWDESTRNFKAPFNCSLEEVCGPPAALEFTVVRNTWARIRSLYLMLMDQFCGREPGIETGSLHPWFSPFEAEIIRALRSPDPFLAFTTFLHAQDNAICDSHWQPQTRHLPFHSDRFRVLRFESLAVDFATWVFPHLQISLDETQPLNLRSPRRHGENRVFWNEQTVRMIAEKYTAEISIFGFAPPLWKSDQ